MANNTLVPIGSQQMARRLEPWMIAAAVLTIPAIVIEQSELADPWPLIAGGLNWLTWGAFLVEAVIMTTVVPDGRTWMRTHPFEVALIVITAPFLPALFQSLRAARVFRVLRVLRLFRIAIGVRRIFTPVGLRWVGVCGMLLILGGGAAYSAVEAKALSTWDGVWWAITTATTVGYGDLSPQTTAGRAIAMAVMLGGIGVVAVFTGAIAERFLAQQESHDDPRADPQILRELAAIQGQLEELRRVIAAQTGTER